MTASADARLAAAGSLLESVAIDLHLAVAALEAVAYALEGATGDEHAAAVALVRKAGATADAAASALGQVNVREPACWLVDRDGQQAMKLLGRRRTA